MTTYLSMDGVDDRLVTPSLTFTDIVMDYKMIDRVSAGVQYHIDARSTGNTTGAYLSSDTNNVESYGAATSAYVNDTLVTNSTNFVPGGTRVTLKLVAPVRTNPITFFARYSLIQFVKVEVYNIKVYNGATLLAHYDMTTGTVNDQSGNGKHATLVGGSWLDDGAGGGGGIAIQADYSTKQIQVATRQTNPLLKQSQFATRELNPLLVQSFYKVGYIEGTTLQEIFESSSNNYTSRQELYAQRQLDYVTLQEIYNASVVRVEDYLLRMVISKQTEETYILKQQLFEAIEDYSSLAQQIVETTSVSTSVKQVIFKEVDQRAFTIQSMHKDVTYEYETLQNMLKDWANYKQFVEFILTINTESSFELGINTKLDFDIKI